jgi:5-methylcytosine-specific restriction protein B
VRFWIFQFNPAKFRWFDWIREKKEAEQWLVTRHELDIRRGDKVAIWASGKNAGIYALGEVITDPKSEPLNEEEKKYFKDKSYNDRFLCKKSVWIKHVKIFIENPLLKTECIEDPILKNMEIFKQSQATVIKLRQKEWERILELLGRRIEEHRI